VIIDMVVGDVKRSCQITVSFQPSTLIIALERGLSPRWFRDVRPSVAANFLLPALAIASDDVLKRARLVLLAGRRGMTGLLTRMPTRLLGLPTLLLAVLMCIFARSRFMACLSAAVRATLQWLATDQPAKNICSPTWLIFKCFLLAKTFFLCQERTFWTIFFLGVAAMLNLRMTTIFRFGTREIAGRWLGATRQRCLKHCSPTRTGDVVENCFFATPAGAPMT